MYKTLEELTKSVEEDQITVIELQVLKDIFSFRRLGNRVLTEIASKLTSKGISYFPRETLENNPSPRHWEEIRLYKKDSEVGKIIESVLNPTLESDTYLIETASSKEGQAAAILDDIRKILGQ